MIIWDLVEMLADWMAAASVKNANIDLDYLQKRFNLSPQLRNIIANTLWCADIDIINYKVPVEYQQINNFLSAKDSVTRNDAEQSVQSDGDYCECLVKLPPLDLGDGMGACPSCNRPRR